MRSDRVVRGRHGGLLAGDRTLAGPPRQPREVFGEQLALAADAGHGGDLPERSLGDRTDREDPARDAAITM